MTSPSAMADCMIRRGILPVALAALMVFSGCSGEESTATAALGVSELKLQYHPGDARILTGVLDNPRDERVTVAQIQVTLFDADNRGIAEMSVVVHDIPAHGSQSFREPVDSDLDVQGARVKQIILP